jgi:hypothetical protein
MKNSPLLSPKEGIEFIWRIIYSVNIAYVVYIKIDKDGGISRGIRLSFKDTLVV